MKKLLVALLLMTGCAYGRYIDAGDEAAKQGQWEVAYRNYAQAAAEDDDSKEAIEKRDAARYQWMMGLANEARADAARGDTLGAIVAARKSWYAWPQHPDAAAVVNEISQKVTQHASCLVSQKDYANAVMLHEAAIRELELVSNTHQNQIQSIKQTWRNQLSKAADDAQAANRLADALLIRAKMTQLSGNVEDKRLAQVLKTQIESEMAFDVGIAGKNRDAKIIADSLVGFRRGTLQISPDGRAIPTRVTLDFTDFEVSDRTQSSTASIEYQDGVRQVPNPTYESRQRDVQSAERDLTEAENDVTRLENKVSEYEQAVAREGDTPNTSTGAEQNLYYARNDLQRAREKVITERNDLLSAKENLSRESPTNDEPVYRTLTYPVKTITRTARARLSTTLLGRLGEQKLVDRIVIEVTDEMHDAQPVAGLAENPLILPDAQEMLARVREAGIEKARNAIIKDFATWRVALLQDAMKLTDPDARVDALVRYILTDPGSADLSASTEIAATRKIADVVGVLTAP